MNIKEFLKEELLINYSTLEIQNKTMKKNIILIILFFIQLQGQEIDDSLTTTKFSDFQLSSERFISGKDGNIMMKVNIWGHVGNPGSHIVYDGIDFASLLSLVGGPNDGANLKKVKVFRELPDGNDRLSYIIDIDQFIKTGDRSNFIKIKPNDTIIIPQKFGDLLIRQIGTVNTIFSLITIYLQISFLFGNG